MPDFAFSPESDWGQAFESFLRSIQEKSGSKWSHKRYKAVLTAFLSSPAKMPNLYLRSDVESFVRAPGTAPGRQGEAVSFGTQNNKLSILKSFYKYCSTYAILDEQGVPRPLLDQLPPTAGMRYVARERPGYRSLTESDIKALFSVIPSTPKGLRDRALLLFLVMTGRRSSEALNLRFGDIQPAIIVDPATGNRRSGFTYSWRGKGAQRFVDSAELPSNCHAAIIRALEASGRLARIAASDYIFIAAGSRSDREDGQPLRHASLFTIVKQYAAAAGLDESRVCPHALRHANAMARALSGQSLLEIAHALRHKNVQMTSLYLKELLNESDSAIPLLEQRFASL